MAKLLMITGLGSARDLASGKKGAFYNTLEEFHKHWDRIDIISPRISRGSTSGGLEVEPLFGNVYVHISPWPLIFHPVWFLKKGLEIYKEQKFDLMTVHEFPPFYNGIGARLLWQMINPVKSPVKSSEAGAKQFHGGTAEQLFDRVKVPYILEIFHVPGYPRGATAKEEIYKSLMRIFIAYDSSKATAIRVMNRQVGEFLKESGIPQEKINLIPAVYVDTDVFKPLNLTKEYDLIFVGRLEPNKGLDLFVEAAKKINAKAIVVGAGSLLNKYKIQYTKYNIQFYGWAKNSDEISELLNKSKILVMPSYNEGGPRVVIEALACGIPVLATPVGIVPDIMKNDRLGNITGWDAGDIAKNAEEILKNYEVYKNAGLETVKQFEKKAAIKNYADKLKQLSTE